MHVKCSRIIVGITGASGALYGTTLLEALKQNGQVEIHLIISNAGRDLIRMELGDGAWERTQSIAHACYTIDDLAAPVSSGSFITEGMIIAPCSVKTLSAIAHAYDDNLIHRAADVVLKERRRLVLLFRETPFTLSHIENMARITNMGGVILPPIPAFYFKPTTIQELVNHSIGKALDLFSLEHTLYARWGQEK